MTEEPKRRGRPPKSHLQEDHHFRPANETPEDAAAAGAPPAPAESGQADAIEVASGTQSASAEPIEAVVENPTIAPDVDIQEVQEMSLIGQPSMDLAPNVESADIGTNSNIIQESPIEEKIHVLVEQQNEPKVIETNEDIDGWRLIDTKIVLKMPPRNGMPIRLSEKPDGQGILAVWKRTRKFANSTHRWEESGKWVDFQSGMDIPFVPKYWKERF